MFKDGASKKDGYDKLSKHQSGDAFDIIAYVPELGGYTYNRDVYLRLSAHIQGTAKRLGYKLRWGGDWDQDFEVADNRFDDLLVAL